MKSRSPNGSWHRAENDIMSLPASASVVTVPCRRTGLKTSGRTSVPVLKLVRTRSERVPETCCWPRLRCGSGCDAEAFAGSEEIELPFRRRLRSPNPARAGKLSVWSMVDDRSVRQRLAASV